VSKLLRFAVVFVALSFSLNVIAIDEAELRKSITQHIQIKVKQRLDELQINRAKQKIEIQLPRSIAKLKPCLSRFEFKGLRPERPWGRTNLQIRCKSAKPYVVRATVNVEVWAKLYVATFSLPRGHVMTAKDVTRRELELSRLFATPIAEIDEIIGLETKRSIRDGRILERKMFNLPLMVRRGDVVSLELKSDKISVMTTALALEAGRKGALIKVRNENSGEILTVRVVASGLVRVRE